jgi:hypothetical protein
MRRTGKRLWVIVALLVVAGAYVTWAAFLARRDLVTLNVRDMEIRKVLSRLEWQTRETILADKDVKGKVTLNVRRAPLEHVLYIIGEQTSSRYTKVYPLYSDSKSKSMLQRALRGELDPAFAGWTNLARRGFAGPFPGGPGGPGGAGPGFGRGGPGPLTIPLSRSIFAVRTFSLPPLP